MKSFAYVYGNLTTSKKRKLNVQGTGEDRYALFSVAVKQYYDKETQEDRVSFIPIIASGNYLVKKLLRAPLGGRVLVYCSIWDRDLEADNDTTYTVSSLRAEDIELIDFSKSKKTKIKAKIKTKSNGEKVERPFEGDDKDLDDNEEVDE